MGKNAMQGLIFDFAEDWVHHHQQTDSCTVESSSQLWKKEEYRLIALTYGNGDLDKFAFLESWPNTVDKIAKQDADDDCQQDPEDEQPV